MRGGWSGQSWQSHSLGLWPSPSQRDLRVSCVGEPWEKGFSLERLMEEIPPLLLDIIVLHKISGTVADTLPHEDIPNLLKATEPSPVVGLEPPCLQISSRDN